MFSIVSTDTVSGTAVLFSSEVPDIAVSTAPGAVLSAGSSGAAVRWQPFSSSPAVSTDANMCVMVWFFIVGVPFVICFCVFNSFLIIERENGSGGCATKCAFIYFQELMHVDNRTYIC